MKTLLISLLLCLLCLLAIMVTACITGDVPFNNAGLIGPNENMIGLGQAYSATVLK